MKTYRSSVTGRAAIGGLFMIVSFFLALAALVPTNSDSAQRKTRSRQPIQPAAVTPSTIPPAPQPVTIRRSVVMDTRPSGTSVVTTSADGTVTVAFDLKWNGRGPHCDATLHLAPDGTITKLDAHGHHMVGAPVEEVTE